MSTMTIFKYSIAIFHEAKRQVAVHKLQLVGLKTKTEHLTSKNDNRLREDARKFVNERFVSKTAMQTNTSSDSNNPPATTQLIPLFENPSIKEKSKCLYILFFSYRNTQSNERSNSRRLRTPGRGRSYGRSQSRTSSPTQKHDHIM